MPCLTMYPFGEKIPGCYCDMFLLASTCDKFCISLDFDEEDRRNETNTGLGELIAGIGPREDACWLKCVVACSSKLWAHATKHSKSYQV